MPEFSFQLKDDFLGQYKNIAPPFGFKDAGGNSLGELVFIRTYSRVKPDGTKGYRDWETDRKSTRLNSRHSGESRMPSSA